MVAMAALVHLQKLNEEKDKLWTQERKLTLFIKRIFDAFRVS